MHILELPRELLLEIWSYVKRTDDIIRFGGTCKRIQQLAFEVDNREIFIDHNASFNVIRNLLSRDLRHLRKIALVVSKCSQDEVLWIQNRITVLATLPNIKKLVCQLQREDRKETTSVVKTLRDTIQKMTWLESVKACFPLSDDYGALFKDHTRLTKLFIFNAIQDGIGFGQLTQIKSMTLPVQAEDRMLKEVVEMTNLTALDITWTDITNESAVHISKLTNLEKIDITSTQEFNWDYLLSLPKLKNLATDVGSPDQQVEKIAQWTQLTRLVMTGNTLSADVVTSYIAKLTNLRDLIFGVRCPGVMDFSMLEKVTTLKCQAVKVDNQILLPRCLKVLELQRAHDNTLKNVFNMDTIESFSVGSHSGDEIMQINRLTNLKELSFLQLPRGIENNLSKLPKLRVLFLNTICKLDVQELKVVTQLCRLVFGGIETSGLDLRTIRAQLPFPVFKQ